MDFYTEQKYIKQGYNFVIGIDEAGRGPLAGPVVASAVAICHSLDLRSRGNPEIDPSFAMTNNLDPRFHGEALVLDMGDDSCNYGDVKDSKKLSPKKREELFELLTQDPDIKYGIGIVSEKIIDKENILQATLIAMKMAVENLIKKESRINPLIHPPVSGLVNGQNSVILIDGKNIIENLDFDQHSIINGDNKVWSIAAASIIAKVTRDRIMRKYHEKYPQYCFDKHKGYGTKLHFEMLGKYGSCEIHRESFLN